jgi:hypothetical protein
MRMRRLVLVMATIWLQTAGAETLSTEDVTWINAFADRMAAQCAERFDRLLSRPGDDPQPAEVMLAIERRVNCECLPTRVRIRATPEVVAALRARNVEVGRAFMQAQARACGAQGLRESALPTCLASEQERAFETEHGRKPEGAELDALPAVHSAMQATCECYAEQFRALDDASLIEEAERSDENFRQREADPAVAPFEGRAHAILNGCRSRASR